MALRQKPLLTVLCERYPDQSKDTILAKILCGEFIINGECIRDPRKSVGRDSVVEFVEKTYVSRGALKLLPAVHEWHIEIRGKIFIDAGASSGGFTDVLLRNGAAGVHAVDVGYNQLDYSIRKDSRVRVHERTNIMKVDSFDPVPHAAVADLSFRSVVKAAAHILTMTREGWMVILVKPQFELRNPVEGFSGVVRKKKLLEDVLFDVLDRFENEDIYVERTIPSPILGRKGNQEFLFLIRRAEDLEGNRTPDPVRLLLKDQIARSDLV